MFLRSCQINSLSAQIKAVAFRMGVSVCPFATMAKEVTNDSTTRSDLCYNMHEKQKNKVPTLRRNSFSAVRISNWPSSPSTS